MAGSESFEAALDRLSEEVGFGILRGAVEVDQVYAHYQHEGMDLKHPRGGQAKYLEQPFYSNVPLYMQDMAARLLPSGNIVQAMADSMEDLSGQVFDHAPWEFNDLRMSGHPTVRRGGVLEYDRPPMVGRLTDEQLRAKNKLRSLSFGGVYADL